MGANSLDVFISSLDEELEIGAATQFSKFFTLKKCLGPKSVMSEFVVFILLVALFHFSLEAYLGKNSVKSAPCMKANSTRRKKTVSRT